LAQRAICTGIMTTRSPDLSVVIPAYNEERRLPPTMDRIREFLEQRGSRYEVLLVDDGSSDGTAAIVEAASANWPQLRLLKLDQNRGKGAAVQRGMLSARGALRLFTDADLSTPIDELPKLEEAIHSGCHIAIGSRAVAGSRVEVHQPLHRELMGKGYNRLLQAMVLPGLHDTQCGFKLFTAPAAQSCFAELQCPGFGFDAEVLLHACASGLRVAEIGVIWRNSRGTRVSPLHDSGRMLSELWRLRRIRGSMVPLPEHT